MIRKDKIALALISHQPPRSVALMREGWTTFTRPDHCIVAYGGTAENFAKIEGVKVFVDDPRLRTKDHQREFQSYSGLLRRVLDTLANEEWDWLFLTEYDLIPLNSDFFSSLIREAENEDADLLAAGAIRLDDTLHSHHGAHVADHGWRDWLAGLSRREDLGVVLSCLGCAQLWRRKTLEGVVNVGEPIPTYLEVLLPTVAHHLGYRVRRWKSHDAFILPHPLPSEDLAELISNGATAAHPIKWYWEQQRPPSKPIGIKLP